jgi:hypothetical protein
MPSSGTWYKICSTHIAGITGGNTWDVKGTFSKYEEISVDHDIMTWHFAVNAIGEIYV